MMTLFLLWHMLAGCGRRAALAAGPPSSSTRREGLRHHLLYLRRLAVVAVRSAPGRLIAAPPHLAAALRCPAPHCDGGADSAARVPRRPTTSGRAAAGPPLRDRGRHQRDGLRIDWGRYDRWRTPHRPPRVTAPPGSRQRVGALLPAGARRAGAPAACNKRRRLPQRPSCPQARPPRRPSCSQAPPAAWHSAGGSSPSARSAPDGRRRSPPHS